MKHERDLKDLSSLISEKDLVKLLSDLVSLPSYPGIPAQETAVAEYILQYFEKAGIEAEVETVDQGRKNVYARLPGSGGGRTLLLNGHTDTVPPYDMPEPLSPRIKGRRLYGRGTSDMKGALACMMTAMKLLKQTGIRTKGDLIFSGVIDEELTSLGTRALLKKGIKADGAVVGEPTGLTIGMGHKGLQWFQFDVHGRAVHGGNQEMGINAIRSASLLIQRIEEQLIPRLKYRIHPIIGRSSVNYGFIQGGFQPSTVAGECVLQIDRRWIPGETYEEVTAEFEEILHELRRDYPDFSCDFSVMEKSIMEEGILHEGFEIDPAHPLVHTAEEAAFQATGRRAEKGSFKAWSDGGLLSSYGGIPTIILGPGDLSCAHTDQEYLDIDQAMEFVMIYMFIGMHFCGREGS
ncbi:MAG: M20 family metallopeptidase [Spirochaetales bacterium]|nr:M20 family metallopeptidase [Spirochaetales bacterium]